MVFYDTDPVTGETIIISPGGYSYIPPSSTSPKPRTPPNLTPEQLTALQASSTAQMRLQQIQQSQQQYVTINGIIVPREQAIKYYKLLSVEGQKYAQAGLKEQVAVRKREEYYDRLRKYGFTVTYDTQGNPTVHNPRGMTDEEANYLLVREAPDDMTFETLSGEVISKKQAEEILYKKAGVKAYIQDFEKQHPIQQEYSKLTMLWRPGGLTTYLDEKKQQIEALATYLTQGNSAQFKKEMEDVYKAEARTKGIYGETMVGFDELVKKDFNADPIGTLAAYVGFFQNEIVFGIATFSSLGLGAVGVGSGNITEKATTLFMQQGLSRTVASQLTNILKVGIYVGLTTQVATTVRSNIDMIRLAEEDRAKIDERVKNGEITQEEAEILYEEVIKNLHIAYSSLLMIGGEIILGYGAYKLGYGRYQIRQPSAFMIETPAGERIIGARYKGKVRYQKYKPYEPKTIKPKVSGLLQQGKKRLPSTTKPGTGPYEFETAPNWMKSTRTDKAYQIMRQEPKKPIYTSVDDWMARSSRIKAAKGKIGKVYYFEQRLGPVLEQPKQIYNSIDVEWQAMADRGLVWDNELLKWVRPKTTTRTSIRVRQPQLALMDRQLAPSPMIYEQPQQLGLMSQLRQTFQMELDSLTIPRVIGTQYQTQLTKTRLKQKVGLIQAEKQKQAYKQSLVLGQLQSQKQAKALALVPLQASLLAQKQEVKTKQALTAVPVIQAPPKEVQKKVRQLRIKLENEKREIKKKRELSEAGYHAYAKKDATKKAHWVKVTKEPVKYKQALGIGADAVDNTVSRTFKVKRAKGKAKNKPIYNMTWGIKKHKFRKPIKKGKEVPSKRWIEKTTYAIDSKGEFEGITVKGWQAARNKAKKGVKQAYKPKTFQMNMIRPRGI